MTACAMLNRILLSCKKASEGYSTLWTLTTRWTCFCWVFCKFVAFANSCVTSDQDCQVSGRKRSIVCAGKCTS